MPFLRIALRWGVLLLLVCCWPAADAIPADIVIGAVLSSDQPRYRIAHRAFQRAMAVKGYEKADVEFITQMPNPDPISWSNAIRKLSAVGANVIVTFGAPATLAALQETHDIPIVFADVYAPLEAGIVKSLATPGTNATGVSSRTPLPTLIKTALEFKRFRQVGAIFSSREIGSLIQVKELKRIAAQENFSVVEVNMASQAMLDASLDSLLTKVDCLYLTEASVVGRNLDKIIRHATEHKVPVISQVPESADRGALVSLEANPAELGQHAADMVIRVLSGKRPSLMAVAAPKKVDLAINMKTARSLDLQVPLQVLNVATRVIK